MKKIIKWIVIGLILIVTAFTTFSTVELYSIVKDLQQQNEQLEIDKQLLIDDNMILSDKIYELEDKLMLVENNSQDKENFVNNDDSEIVSSISRNQIEKNAIITYYAELPNEFGDGSVTASGKQVQDGFIAAPNEYEFGTEIVIDGKTYTVEDRGGYINTLEDGTLRLNIFVPRLDGESDIDYNNRVLQMGVVETIVYINDISEKESQKTVEDSNVVENISQDDIIIQEEIMDQNNSDNVVKVIEEEIAIDNEDDKNSESPSKLSDSFNNVFEVPENEELIEVVEVVERENSIVNSIVQNKEIIIKTAIVLVFVILVIVMFSGNGKKNQENIELSAKRKKYEMQKNGDSPSPNVLNNNITDSTNLDNKVLDNKDNKVLQNNGDSPSPNVLNNNVADNTNLDNKVLDNKDNKVLQNNGDSPSPK